LRGTLAVLTALRHPERVEALVVAPAVYAGGGSPGWLRPLLRSPQMRRLGPCLMRSISTRGEAILRAAWHDPSGITPEVLAGYQKPLQAQNWDRALWELPLASHGLGLEDQLYIIQMPTLVITGDDDCLVPTEQSVRLAAELPNGEWVVIPACGHVPQEECPEAFLQAMRDFLAALP
jgi:pimeloyl-ACP methyl ester carboxylesterase